MFDITDRIDPDTIGKTSPNSFDIFFIQFTYLNTILMDAVNIKTN